MRLAFDADVLIYAGQTTNEYGPALRALLEHPNLEGQRYGSCLLLPELLSKPMRLAWHTEVAALTEILLTLELIPLDEAVATLAAQLGAAYALKAPDAIHLASAVAIGADAFITNNTKDFQPAAILELRVISPNALESLSIT